MNKYRYEYVFDKNFMYDGEWFDGDDYIEAENIIDAMDIAVRWVRVMVADFDGYMFNGLDIRVKSAQIRITLVEGDTPEDKLYKETYFEWYD